MSYYILPKINNQIVINPSKTSEELFKPYISYSLLKYITTIQCHINNNILDLDDLSFNNYNELIKYINPCEYIFSKIPGSKYSVSKLKPTSNLFYDFLEVFSALNVFDIYANSSIHSLHISNSISDTIECFEMIRENYEDKIISYNNFNEETINEINNFQEKFDFLLFEEEFTNLNNYFEFLAKCMLTILKCQMKKGSCIIKIDNTCYKPVIDIIYILSSLYDKVYILKPNSSNITTFEKYIVCKNYQCKTDFCRVNYYTLQTLIKNTNTDNSNNIINSFLDYDTPYYFLSKIDDINVIIGHQQIESLDLISNILKNKNREDRIETFRKTNIIKSIAWCEKYKIPCNKFSEKINIFLPLNKSNDESIEEDIEIVLEL
jgi:hypothetical protein